MFSYWCNWVGVMWICGCSSNWINRMCTHSNYLTHLHSGSILILYSLNRHMHINLPVCYVYLYSYAFTCMYDIISKSDVQQTKLKIFFSSQIFFDSFLNYVYSKCSSQAMYNVLYLKINFDSDNHFWLWFNLALT